MAAALSSLLATPRLSTRPGDAPALCRQGAGRQAALLRCAAAAGGGGGAHSGGRGKEKEETVTGVVFKPFEEVAPMLKQTAGMAGGGKHRDLKANTSFARGRTFTDECEAAVNEQINVEYNVSYVYHAMASFFDRDAVGLPGFASYFRHSSLEERGHAQKLIDLQNTRGGRVRLNAILAPEADYDHADKGEALYAMELSLSLEKLNFDKLMGLWEVLDTHGDPQLTQYIEEMLQEQAEDIKKAADYVSQLRRVGKGLGVWQVDHELYEEELRSRAIPGI